MRYTAILLGTTLAAAIAYFALALALFPARIEAEYWVREMLVIKRNIVKQYDGRKKIIIASGSNSLFGIDTKQLTEEFHIPVINYGLHAGLPLQTILAEAAAAAEKGDTVILPLESGYYCMSTDVPTNWHVRNTIAWDLEKWEDWPIAKRIKAVAMTDARIVLEMVQARLQERFHARGNRQSPGGIGRRKDSGQIRIGTRAHIFCILGVSFGSTRQYEKDRWHQGFWHSDSRRQKDRHLPRKPAGACVIHRSDGQLGGRGVFCKHALCCDEPDRSGKVEGGIRSIHSRAVEAGACAGCEISTRSSKGVVL